MLTVFTLKNVFLNILKHISFYYYRSTSTKVTLLQILRVETLRMFWRLKNVWRMWNVACWRILATSYNHHQHHHSRSASMKIKSYMFKNMQQYVYKCEDLIKSLIV